MQFGGTRFEIGEGSVEVAGVVQRVSPPGEPCAVDRSGASREIEIEHGVWPAFFLFGEPSQRDRESGIARSLQQS